MRLCWQWLLLLMEMCTCSRLPPPDFVDSFMSVNSLSEVVFHVPLEKQSVEDLVRLKKSMR